MLMPTKKREVFMTQKLKAGNTSAAGPASHRIAGMPKAAASLLILALFAATAASPATGKLTPYRTAVYAQSPAQGCRKLELSGEVKAGEQWSAPLGQGWTFRILPIAPSGRGYTGWDLAVSPPSDENYPDALLLGTPPYGSLTEREIGTTFGLRAQDAIAWEPRRFHFLTTAKDVQHARDLYGQVIRTPASATATDELLGMVSGKATANPGAGQFKIVDARLMTGADDPAPYARQWAMHLHQVPHTVIQPDAQAGAAPSPRGQLLWIRFAASLWLPEAWKTPGATPAACVP